MLISYNSIQDISDACNSFDIGIMVIPPGQSVSCSYKVNDFWSYREKLEGAGELTFRRGYSYDENAPAYQLSFS